MSWDSLILQDYKKLNKNRAEYDKMVENNKVYLKREKQTKLHGKKGNFNFSC